MTTRRRRTSRGSARRGRTSRLVWVNDQANFDTTSTGLQLADILTNAGTLKHDATIIRVLGTLTVNGMRITNTVGSQEVQAGLWVGSEQSLITTIPDPDLTTEEPSWLWRHSTLDFLQGDGTLATESGRIHRHFVVDVKASRRFRENFMTLWCIINTVQAGAVTNSQWQFDTRTLLRVP